MRVSENIMNAHIAAGEIPEPFQFSVAALKVLRGLTKILDFLPKRLRITEPGLKVAETDVVKRTAQYMNIKKWVTENQETLIL